MAGRQQMNGNGAPKPIFERDYRCPQCGRLWFKARLSDGTRVHIRCPKCGKGAFVTRESGVNQVADESAQIRQIPHILPE